MNYPQPGELDRELVLQKIVKSYCDISDRQLTVIENCGELTPIDIEAIRIERLRRKAVAKCRLKKNLIC